MDRAALCWRCVALRPTPPPLRLPSVPLCAKAYSTTLPPCARVQATGCRGRSTMRAGSRASCRREIGAARCLTRSWWPPRRMSSLSALAAMSRRAVASDTPHLHCHPPWGGSYGRAGSLLARRVSCVPPTPQRAPACSPTYPNLPPHPRSAPPKTRSSSGVTSGGARCPPWPRDACTRWTPTRAAACSNDACTHQLQQQHPNPWHGCMLSEPDRSAFGAYPQSLTSRLLTTQVLRTAGASCGAGGGAARLPTARGQE